MAMLMRGELARPGLQFLSPEQYNQLFTMHGTIMLLIFATPLFFAFAQPDHAAADRRARRRVPAAERLLLLAVPVRQHDRRVRASSPRAAPPTSAGRPTRRCPTSRNSPGRRRQPVDRRPGRQRSGHDPRWRQLHRHDRLPAGARHDAVPDADLHLEHPGHQRADPAGVPDPDRGADGAAGRPQPRRAGLHAARTAGRCCGSTCSGSSATPRSTSSRCRSSASSPRSSRCSAASRCSATRAWSARRCASAPCRWRCGRTTCSPPARCCCRSSPS